MLICGIDPGLKGGIAFLDYFEGKRTLHTYPMPLLKKQIDVLAFAKLLENWKPDLVVIEDLLALRIMNRKSIQTCGLNYGKLLSVAISQGIEVETVKAITWQNHTCPKKLFPYPDTKTRAFKRASQLHPTHDFHLGRETFHDGLTDATLIAEYGVILSQTR